MDLITELRTDFSLQREDAYPYEIVEAYKRERHRAAIALEAQAKEIAELRAASGQLLSEVRLNDKLCREIAELKAAAAMDDLCGHPEQEAEIERLEQENLSLCSDLSGVQKEAADRIEALEVALREILEVDVYEPAGATAHVIARAALKQD